MSWSPDLKDVEGPIYLAIARAIGLAVESGELLDGVRLPTQREMAKRLGVDLTTVTRAYAEAQRAGYVVSDGRRGTFVRGRVSATPPLRIVAERGISEATARLEHLDIASLEAADMNSPPEPAGKVLQSAMSEGVEAILARNGYLPVHYQPSGGSPFDRAARAEMLSGVGPTQPDQVVITAGSQNAIHAICAALISPGDRAACGVFAYPGFLAVARRLGAEVLAIPMDEEGIIPEGLEEILRDQPIKLLFVVPSNDNPTTATLPPGRRNALAEMAERHGFWIIEDDAYGGAAGPFLPITSYAPNRTWYLSSLSKTLTPSLRVATVRAPSVRLAFELAADIQETALMAPPLSVALATHWLVSGALPKLIGAVSQEAMARQQIARDILGPRAFRAAPRGSHIWLPRPDGAPGADPIDAVLSGLPVSPARMFAVQPTGLERSLRVSLGGLRSRERLAADLSRLDAALALGERRRA